MYARLLDEILTRGIEDCNGILFIRFPIMILAAALSRSPQICKVVKSELIDTNGSGHGALAGVLSAVKADVLICGGIGGGAQIALAQSGIKLYGGVSGVADEAVNALVTGNLVFNPDVHCEHHDHEHGGKTHTCGDHGCGHGHCGNH